ncbi:MAG TPA: aquaporin [Vicinamibacterales bacterium]|nr:aquaporin [Vicinamibacterales bacterium]
MMTTLRVLAAEALGTFYLCFAGIAAILCTQPPINAGGGLVAIALAHGLALSIAVSNFGGISGAHVNPAVTLGLMVTGRVKPALAMLYIVAQLLGASIAALTCREIFPMEAINAGMLGIPLPAAWASTGTIFCVEFVLTFLLVTSVFGTAVDERGKTVKIGGFGIGLTVAFDILAGGPITGASMNPARSFGPALVMGHWEWHWLYWVAPVLGGMAAALFYHAFLLVTPDEPPVKEEYLDRGRR